ncbi:uncharacterized protein LOC134457349 [Engraulis encrasicolus]|uniref:uncharacterized protein LOC134457349 n=1 Tax=Engraulis encrasicolus TaxID=184585 RepID=UPI002FD790CE
MIHGSSHALVSVTQEAFCSSTQGLSWHVAPAVQWKRARVRTSHLTEARCRTKTHRLNEEFHLKGGATPPPPPPFSPPPPSPQAVTTTTADISRSSKGSRNAGDNNLSRQNSQHSILQTLKSPSPHQEAVISELKHLTISCRGAPDNQYVKAQPFTQPHRPENESTRRTALKSTRSLKLPRPETTATDPRRLSVCSRRSGGDNTYIQPLPIIEVQAACPEQPPPLPAKSKTARTHATNDNLSVPIEENLFIDPDELNPPYDELRSPTLYQPQFPHTSAPLLDNNYYHSPTGPPRARLFSHPPASGDAAAPSFEQHYQRPTGPPRRLFSHPPTSRNGAASLLDQHYQRPTGTTRARLFSHPPTHGNAATPFLDNYYQRPTGPPRRASLYHSLSVDDAYEAWRSNNTYRNAPDLSRPRLQRQYSLPFAAQDLPTNRRMSEGELKRLLVWWSSVKGSAHIPCQEMDVIEISIEAQRVRLAILLFNALLVSRETIFNDSISELNNMVDKLGGGGKKMKAAGIAGGTVGGVGVAATVAGVALAPCTMGLSLILTAAGVGMVAGGGAGGALAVKSKTANTQRKKKVEEIVQDYKSNMADVEDCLGFIAVGMERLSRIHPTVVQQLDEETYTMHQLAEALRGQVVNLRLSRRSSSLSASGMDILISKKDKNSEAARKIREQAELMKNGLRELMDIRDKINYADSYGGICY